MNQEGKTRAKVEFKPRGGMEHSSNLLIKYMKGAYKQKGNQFFARSDSDRAKGNYFNLKEKKIR